MKYGSILVLKVPKYIVEDSAPQYVEVLPSDIKTYIAQEATTMSTARLLAVGIIPPIVAMGLGTYIVGGWPSDADPPDVRSEKKRVIIATVVTGIAVGTVTALLAKMMPAA